jgi:hypothetical protein
VCSKNSNDDLVSNVPFEFAPDSVATDVIVVVHALAARLASSVAVTVKADLEEVADDLSASDSCTLPT